MFRQIAKAEIGENKNLCISTSDKGITIAQEVIVKGSTHKDMSMFLKGAIHLSNVSQLQVIRDAMNVAIEEMIAYEQHEMENKMLK